MRDHFGSAIAWRSENAWIFFYPQEKWINRLIFCHFYGDHSTPVLLTTTRGSHSAIGVIQTNGLHHTTNGEKVKLKDIQSNVTQY